MIQKRRVVLLTVMLSLILTLFVPATSAIGLRAPLLKDKFFFEPGFQRGYDISFYTNSGITQDYELYVRMHESEVDLTEYVTLDKYYVESVPSGRLVDFHIDVDLPNSIETPGIHEIRVGVKEVANGATGMVSAVTASEMRIIVIVLHPGNYIISRFTAPNANINEDMAFVFDLDNYGTSNTEARGEVTIFNEGNELVGSAIASPETIISTRSMALTAPFNTKDLPPAKYTARAKLYWYDQVEEFEQEFKVGTASVTIDSLTTSFLTDAINKFKIRVDSGWNNNLHNVYVTVNVFDSDGNIVSTFATPNGEILPWEFVDLLGYFDTTGLLEGEYEAVVSVSFDGGRDHNEKFTFTISKEATTETVEELPSASFLTVELLLVAIIVLLMLLISLLLLLLRKNQKPVSVVKNEPKQIQ